MHLLMSFCFANVLIFLTVPGIYVHCKAKWKSYSTCFSSSTVRYHRWVWTMEDKGHWCSWHSTYCDELSTVHCTCVWLRKGQHQESLSWAIHSFQWTVFIIVELWVQIKYQVEAYCLIKKVLSLFKVSAGINQTTKKAAGTRDWQEGYLFLANY